MKFVIRPYLSFIIAAAVLYWHQLITTKNKKPINSVFEGDSIVEQFEGKQSLESREKMKKKLRKNRATIFREQDENALF